MTMTTGLPASPARSQDVGKADDHVRNIPHTFTSYDIFVNDLRAGP